MSRFIAILNGSDPDLVTNIEDAGGYVVSVSEPGFVVVDGDQTVADSVSQLQAVQAVSPVDSTWDTSDLSLGDDVGSLVSAWNTSLGADYQAALTDPYRAGEEWEFPGGCDPSNLSGDGGGGGGLVADNGDGSGTGGGDATGTGTGTGSGAGTGDTSSGQVATNDPSSDDGGFGGFGGFDEGEQA